MSAAQSRRIEVASADPPEGDERNEGAERYIWTYAEGDGVVLRIPGVRDLKFNIDDALSLGQMIIDTAIEANQSKH